MHICVLQIVTQINWFRPTLVNFFWSTSKFLFFREAWILSRSCGEDGEDGTEDSAMGKRGVTVQKDRIADGQERDGIYFFASDIPSILPLLPCSGSTGGPSSAAARRLHCLFACGGDRQMGGGGGGLWNSLHSCYRAQMSSARHKSAVSRAEGGLCRVSETCCMQREAAKWAKGPRINFVRRQLKRSRSRLVDPPVLE